MQRNGSENYRAKAAGRNIEAAFVKQKAGRLRAVCQAAEMSNENHFFA